MGLLVFFIGLVVGCAAGVLMLALLSLCSRTGEDERVDEIFLGAHECQCPDFSCYFPAKKN